MKKQLSILSFIALGFVALTNSGCKKEKPDTDSPVVTVNGLKTCYLQKGRLYVDADATAMDVVDGTLKVTSSGGVAPSVVGTYTITYSATDLSGNTGTATRTVYVVDLEGSYTQVLNYRHYPQLYASDTSRFDEFLFLSVDMKGQLNFSLFGGHAGGAVYSYLSSGSSLDVPTQTVNCGAPLIDRTFSGSGAISNTNAPHTKITLNYTEVSDSTYHSRMVFVKD